MLELLDGYPFSGYTPGYLVQREGKELLFLRKEYWTW